MNQTFDFDPDPWTQFHQWYNDAVQSKIKNPEAMTLATATPRGVPSARIVLFKGMNTKGFKFYTHYKSRKGLELKANPRASLLFYWSTLDRQIRIEGKIERVSKADSDQYWHSRPRESCLSALASNQSQPIAGREALEKKFKELSQKFINKKIPRPAHWGGYVLIPQRFEFWIAGNHRLHDRYCYLKKGKNWKILQLGP